MAQGAGQESIGDKAAFQLANVTKTPPRYGAMNPPLIASAREAERLIAGGALVLDATASLAKPLFDGDYRLESGRAAWLEARIPGARHADLVHDFSRHSPACSFGPLERGPLLEALSSLGFSGREEVLVYDSRDGLWAARLWLALRSVGIEAHVLSGGLSAWREEGLPVESGECLFRATRSFAQPEASSSAAPELWADIEDARAVSEGRAVGTLVCALSSELFAGTAITRYSRRGHIPGSISLPARNLLDGQNRLLPPREIAAKAKSVLDGRPEPYILYCGGGITASMLALCLFTAGYDRISVYSGSLQEWSARLDLPMDLGGKAADGGESAPAPAADGCLS